VAASALACASAVAGDPGDPKVPGSSGVGVGSRLEIGGSRGSHGKIERDDSFNGKTIGKP